MNKHLKTISVIIALSLLSVGIVFAARPGWRHVSVDDQAYCAAVQGALGADLGVHHHPSLDLNGNGYTDGSDLAFFAAKANDYAWCRSVLTALVNEATPSFHGSWDGGRERHRHD